MELKPIESEEEYESVMEWIDEQLDKKPDPKTREGYHLQIALLLVKAYEDMYYPVPLPDPIDTIKSKMEEKGLKSKDLVEWVGSKSYVSALLNRRKPLTLRLARIFHEKLGIPPQVLLN